jgi:hypothetical protein
MNESTGAAHHPARRSSLDGVEATAFTEALETPAGRRRSGGSSSGSRLRLVPALSAAAVALLVTAAVIVLPTMRHGFGGTMPTGGSNATNPGYAGQGLPGQGLPGQGYPGGVGAGGPSGGGSYALTYANQVTVGLAAKCCSTFGGTWPTHTEGGYPDYRGPAAVTNDPAAWFEWNLGQPSGGRRWDQMKLRVWIPRSPAGAWVRYTVTATHEGATDVTTFDVPQQEYQGWYELPGTFSVGSPDQRTGSAWVRMTYLRPYSGPAADGVCRSGGCQQMAAGQVQFMWS